MRHPFQRPSNDRDTVRTPFQKAVVGYIAAYDLDGRKMSGRRLSQLLGKSANHISQMLNDGFVPSGSAILDMARVLELGSEDTDRLIRAAMETKAGQRSRDNFWINQTTRMLAEADRDRGLFVAFLRKEGLLRKWRDYKRAAAKRKKTG